MKIGIFRSTGVYIATNILVSSLPILLLPILTRYLSPEEYGTVAIFQSLQVFFGAIFGFSVNGFCNIKYFEVNQDKNIFSKYVGNSVILLLVSMFLGLIFLVFTSRYISELLDINRTILFLLPFSCFAQYIIYIRLGTYQMFHKSYHYGAVNFSLALTNVMFTLILVILFKFGILGRVGAIVSSLSILSVIAIYLLRTERLIDFDYCRNMISESFRYGLSYAPIIVSASFIPLAERAVISSKLNNKDLGVYIVEIQISSGLMLMISSFMTAYTPIVYKKLSVNRVNNKTLKSEFIAFITFLLLTIFGVMSGLVNFILEFILPDAYYSSIPLTLVLLISVAIRGGVVVWTIYFTFYKKNKFLSFVNLSTGMVGILLMYFFVEDYGIMSAGYSVLISRILALLVIFIGLFYLIKKE
ncbi:lipopolysaccharide biosynthesis protein [Vibrio breoganii]|uniref:lipopolysaccharide biosynthesis protein n=1 Tax=Vibrio breoganii TaxID=553239 RepID=UPI000CB766BB|nr:oligosaccharide flippase family protein [Vibrio breoganii]PMG94748.1 hypothetical protein BCU80_06125 [Vibrio breoganii]